MKCANCGSELWDGCLYCSNCGKEAQIVPDYNVFEDEYLKTILELENQKKETASVSRKTYQTQKGKKTSGKRKKEPAPCKFCLRQKNSRHISRF